MATDMLIDEHEVDIEEECLKMLALYQPVAGDLRFIAAMIKINSELERIGDLASNIAERATELAAAPPIGLPGTLPVMADRVQAILEKALDALVRQDAVTARRVLVADDEIDDLYRTLLGQLKDQLRATPTTWTPSSRCSAWRATWSAWPTTPPTSPKTCCTWWRARSRGTACPTRRASCCIWTSGTEWPPTERSLSPPSRTLGSCPGREGAQGGPDSPYRVRAAATYGIRPRAGTGLTAPAWSWRPA